MKTVATHEYLAFIFQDKHELKATLKGLQALIKHNDYPAIQLHYSKAYADRSSATIKRLKFIYSKELPSKSERQIPVWEEN